MADLANREREGASVAAAGLRPEGANLAGRRATCTLIRRLCA